MSADEISEKKGNWRVQPFERCLDYITEIDRVLNLSMEGMSLLTQRPAIAKALIDLRQVEEGSDSISPEEELSYKIQLENATFAKDEISKGYPILHAHALISLWGAFDALAIDIACIWLLNVPSLLESEQFSKIRISLAEFELLEKEDRMNYLVKEFARSQKADLKLGIDKFEVIMESIGLAGEVDADVRKTLLEMSQIRNVLVHRAGIVDRRFKKICPWIDAAVGSLLRVNHSNYKRYSEAMYNYVLCLVNRARKHAGMEPYVERQAEKEGSTGHGA